MTEKRFSYNPFTEHFVKCTDSHAIALHNLGQTSEYDEYIRGIILDGVLYLRTYYPFKDLYELTLTELHRRSKQLLEDNKNIITLLILKEYNIKIKEIKYNAENDLLKGIGLVNI